MITVALLLALLPQTVDERLDDFDRRLRAVEAKLGPLVEMRAGLDGLRAQMASRPDGAMTVTYKDGLRFSNDDVEMQIGGRIHTDFTHGSAESSFEDMLGDIEDGVRFRRARVNIEGTFHDKIKVKTQYDFAGGDAEFKDAYIEFLRLCGANSLRVGFFKEPVSLEAWTSSNFITFVERSLMDVLVPAENTGIMVHGTTEDGNAHWALGAFRDSDGFAGSDSGFGDDNGDGEGALTGRVTWRPWVDEASGGRRYAHVGASVSRRSPDDDMIEFEAVPEAKRAPDVADTGMIPADALTLAGVEAAFVNGPFSIQGEMIQASVDGKDAADADPRFLGAYVQASYFLTGESRPYKSSKGGFDRVVPDEPWTGEDGGLGAWEVTGRYSHLDLDDDGVDGGEVDDLTVGLNWYLDRNTRVMFNTIATSVDEAGDGKIYLVRFQRDF